MRSTKRFITVLATVLLCLALMTVSAYAAEEVASGTCGDDLTWVLDSEGTLTISGTGEMSRYDYTEWRAPWYSYAASVKSVFVEPGVTTIGDAAFYKCVNLTSVSIPDSVVSIGERAFYQCYSLPEITIPDSVTEVGDSAFRDCGSLADEDGFVIIQGVLYDYVGSASDITIPNSVTTIGTSAFWRSSVTGVTIPDSVTSIGTGAFSSCTSLTDITIPDSVTSIGSGAFRSCDALADEDGFVVVRGVLYDYVGSEAHLTIPAGVTVIDELAFYSCNTLISVVIPEGVTTIRADAFNWCDNLTDVVIADSVATIGEYAFYECSSLTNLTMSEGLTSIGMYAFYGCTSLTDLTVPSTVTFIGQYAFAYCDALTEVEIPANVTVMERAFHACANLNGIWVSPDNRNYASDENGVLYNKDKTHLLRVPATTVGSYTVADGVTKIEISAFSDCTSLTGVTIPDSVIEIGLGAFQKCTALTDITIPDSVTSIGDHAFTNCTSLTGITIPDSVTSIGGYAFDHCKALTNITIPDSVTKIGDFLFGYCDALANVTIPSSVTSIGNYAFYKCTSLSNIYYTGSESDWTNIEIGSNNECIDNATIHYNYVKQLEAPVITKLENTANGIKLTWDAIDGADQYRIYAKTSKGWLALGTTSANSFVYTSAKSGYTYTFTVRCLNAAGTAFTSSFNADGWSQKYVAQPAISKLENTANGIKLTWDAVAGVGKYRIYAKTSKGWLALGTTTDTSFTYTKAISGYTYTFTVRCLNAEGTAFTSSFNTTGWKQTYVAQPAISKLENTAGGIKITWNAVAGAGKYRVYAKTSKGWLNLGTTTGTSFTYANAISGYTYTFTVRALNATGTAFVSSFNTTGWKQTYVAQPAISKLENTANGIKITWNAVAGAGKYRVYAKTSKGWLALGTTTANTFTYTGAKSGLTYTFTVRALNAAGTAFVSSFNTTGWRQKYVDYPTITKFENTAGGIKLTWNAMAGAGQYRVYAKTSKGWLALGTTTSTSFVYTNAISGYTYTFTVRALNAEGTAFVGSFNTTGWKQTYIAQPTVTKLTNTTSGINITWGAVPGAARYRVYLKTATGWTCVGHTTDTSFTWTEAQSGVNYTFTVRCVNAANNAFTSSFNTTGWSIKNGIYDFENPDNTDSGWGDIT